MVLGFLLGATATSVGTSLYLNNKINSNNKRINQIDAEVTNYQQGIADAQKARDSFIESNSAMNSLIDSTMLYFRGEAAPQFRLRLMDFRRQCEYRSNDMNDLIDIYNGIIDKLEEERAECVKSVEKYEDTKNSLKWFLFF